MNRLLNFTQRQGIHGTNGNSTTAYCALALSTSLIASNLLFSQDMDVNNNNDDIQQQHGRQGKYQEYHYPSMSRWSNMAVTYCESPPSSTIPTTIKPNNEIIQPLKDTNPTPNTPETATQKQEDVVVETVKEELFQNLFPLRQLWSPKVAYPLWDDDWDGRKLEVMDATDDAEKDKERMKKRLRYIRKKGVTRHVILIRHGQYDESSKLDEERILTPLGRQQAEKTGERLAEMMKGFSKEFGPCNITRLHVSNMARAKETANIIAKHLPSSVTISEPNPDLNEGRPCHHVPGRYSEDVVKQVDSCHDRVENAFKKYFYRADPPPPPSEVVEETHDGKATDNVASSILPNSYETTNDTTVKKDEDSKEVATEEEKKNEVAESPEEEKLEPHPQHEFEIVVCHANVIRYCLCRALQIPPEAWLRFTTFNCSLTYLMVRPHGSVSCRMVGDIGHLGLENSTFSMHTGFNW